MYSSESFFDLIKEHVSKLNDKWFLGKQSAFMKHPNYDGEHNVISIPVKDYEEHDPVYDKEGEIVSSRIVDASYTIKIDLRRYCHCYFPIDEITNWGDAPVEDFISSQKVTPSNNIDEFAREIVSVISHFLKPDSDNVEVYKFVSTVLDLIEKELKLLKGLHQENGIYDGILDDFLRKCTSIAFGKYGRELTFYKVANDYTPKLEFTLDQNQLLALIFILQRAGFFNYSEITPILRFVLDHFLYKDEVLGEFVSPSGILNLQKKFSAVASSQAPKSKQDISHNGLNAVEKALREILEKLR